MPESRGVFEAVSLSPVRRTLVLGPGCNCCLPTASDLMPLAGLHARKHTHLWPPPRPPPAPCGMVGALPVSEVLGCPLQRVLNDAGAPRLSDVGNCFASFGNVAP